MFSVNAVMPVFSVTSSNASVCCDSSEARVFSESSETSVSCECSNASVVNDSSKLVFSVKVVIRSQCVQ